MTNHTTDRSTELKEQVKQDARDLKEEAKSEARTRARKAKSAAADKTREAADVMRSTADAIDDKEFGRAGDYMRSMANKVEEFSDTISDKPVDELLQQAQRFARENPAMFVGGALLLGFAAARFLKSSDERSANSDAYYYDNNDREFDDRDFEDDEERPSFSAQRSRRSQSGYTGSVRRYPPRAHINGAY